MNLRDDEISLTCGPTRESLHAAVSQLYERAKERIAMRDPEVVDNDTGEVHERRYMLLFAEQRDPRSLRQLRFYWGPVLRQIAEQAPGGWTADAWHEAFKRTILGYEIEVVKVAGKKRPVTYRRLRSSTKLSVKQMSEYLDQVIATAANDLGVVFQLDPAEREAVRYRPKRAAKKSAAPQTEETTA